MGLALQIELVHEVVPLLLVPDLPQSVQQRPDSLLTSQGRNDDVIAAAATHDVKTNTGQNRKKSKGVQHTRGSHAK